MYGYITRSHHKKSRWMYVPEYREPFRFNWRELAFEALISCPLASLLILVIIKAAETL